MASDTYGRPGGYANVLAWKARLRVAAGWIVALAAIVMMAGPVTQHLPGLLSAGPSALEPLYTSPVVLGSAVVALASYAFAEKSRIDVRKAAVGIRSEKLVARQLKNVGAEAVVHGALIGGGGDVDHVVLGPCAVAVETKTGKGRMRLDGRTIRVGRKTIPGDPIGQVRRQAKALSRITGQPTASVVCIPEMTSEPRAVGDVVICAAQDLSDVIRAAPSVLPSGRGRQLAQQLHAGKYDD